MSDYTLEDIRESFKEGIPKPPKLPGPIDLKNFSGPENNNIDLEAVSGYLDQQGDIIPQDQIDNKESDKIAIQDRIMALNFGDPTGALGKLKSLYPKYTFTRDDEGDIAFKSPNASAWSNLDPKSPAIWSYKENKKDMSKWNPLKYVPQNAVITRDLPRDILDLAPDVAQGVASAAAGLAGTIAGGPGLGLLSAGGADAALEGARQRIGQETGWREAPISGQEMANQGMLAAANQALIGAPIGPRQAEKAAAETTLKSTIWNAIRGREPGTRGVEIANKLGYGVPSRSDLPAGLAKPINEAIAEQGRGVLQKTADVLVESATKVGREAQKRAMEPLPESAQRVLDAAGVTFDQYNKPKTYLDAAKEIQTQNSGGKIVEAIADEAENAVKIEKRTVGKQIETGLKDSKTTIDLSDEKKVLDDYIAELKAEKAKDPTGATHFDEDIAQVEALRNEIFGGAFKQKPRKDLGPATVEAVNKGMPPEAALRLRETNPESIYAFIEGPGKQQNMVVSASVAFQKLKKLSDEIKFGADVSSKGAAYQTRRGRAIEVYDKLSNKINEVLEKDYPENLRAQYKKYVKYEKSIDRLFNTVNSGLSTSKAIFNDSKGHVKKDLLDFDREFKTNIVDQLTLLDVARVNGTPESWFPKSMNGSTSTSSTIQGQAMGGAIANGIGINEKLGQFVGGLTQSTGVTNKVLAAQRAADRLIEARSGKVKIPWTDMKVDLSRIPPLGQIPQTIISNKDKTKEK